MTRFTLLATLALALPLAAQQPDAKPAAAPSLPDGWQVRFDRANANAAAAKFATMGSGFHVTHGPAAIYWNPSMSATGAYEVRAQMVQTKPSQHPEAYGVLFAGSNLDKDDQSYLYFLVRQDGKYLIKHRAGSETHTIVDWTAHPAIKVPEGQGSAANALTVKVAADSVRLLVNDQQVRAFPRSELQDGAGLVGLRVNHNLDVHVGKFEVAKG